MPSHLSPSAIYQYCQLNPVDCAAQVTNANPPRITEYGWDIIRRINIEVNTSIMPMTDDEIYGRQEVWAMPTDAGDCEDYV